ncbi:MAG: hypothetical protein JWO06_255 [Bacteroidota bacterium]|nr:hypothetical protein [Bacteroidota bacterium]
MYYGAKPVLFEFAKRMRYAPTEAERLMWQILSNSEFRKYKFRRQHPIASFIADFYSHPLLLVIEIDGGYHLKTEQREYDIFRDEDIQAMGITVLRFLNNEIKEQPGVAINKLKDIISKQPTSSIPFPHKRG